MSRTWDNDQLCRILLSGTYCYYVDRQRVSSSIRVLQVLICEINHSLTDIKNPEVVVSTVNFPRQEFKIVGYAELNSRLFLKPDDVKDVIISFISSMV